MTPNKLASILPELSDRTGLSEELISQIARVYYQQVQVELSSLSHLNLDIPGLGVFVLKPKALARKIDRTKALIKKSSAKTSFRARTITEQLTTDLVKLEELQKKYETEQLRKLAIKDIRHGTTQSNIPESESDFGGDS